MITTTRSSICRKSHRRGFTLTELLVVIAIIAVLSVVGFFATSRVRVSAAKANAMTQMREIGVGALSWMADNAATEPFYFHTNSGDYPNEASSGGKYIPGNPAVALYSWENPDTGFIRDPAVFFSPLTKMKAPARENYRPHQASSSRPWGTYVWVYPFVHASNRTGRQMQILDYQIGLSSKINPALEGRLMMHEVYSPATHPDMIPRYGKEIYHALMADGSVQYVADSTPAFNRWKTGE